MSLRECVKRRAARLCREKHSVMELLLLSAASLSSLPTAPPSDTGPRLSSPGEVENIVEGGGSWVDVIRETSACVRTIV